MNWCGFSIIRFRADPPKRAGYIDRLPLRIERIYLSEELSEFITRLTIATRGMKSILNFICADKCLKSAAFASDGFPMRTNGIRSDRSGNNKGFSVMYDEGFK